MGLDGFVAFVNDDCITMFSIMCVPLSCTEVPDALVWMDLLLLSMMIALHCVPSSVYLFHAQRYQMHGLDGFVAFVHEDCITLFSILCVPLSCTEVEDALV